MSQGPFATSVYLSDEGLNHPVSVQPETLQLVLGGVTNNGSGDAPDTDISAIVAGSRRRLGIFTRTVTITWDDPPPTGYQLGGTITLPWLQPTGFDSLRRGVTGTYLGVGVRVVSRRGEERN